MTTRMSGRRGEQRGLKLIPVGLALGVTFAVAVAVAGFVFFTGWDLLDVQGLKPERRIDAKTLFDLVKLAFGVVAGAGALVALVVAYRRQRVDEDAALREATRLHTERFTAAVSQVGQESAAVRLGGVHALAGLADDAPTTALRQTCIDVLCAYLRLPYIAESALPAGDVRAEHEYRGLREVRHTVIRLVRDHLRLEEGHRHAWRGHDFDFTGVVFDGGDFSGAVFGGGTARFTGAVFAGTAMSFAGVQVLPDATLDFTRAVFAGARVDFARCAFKGGSADFTEALFRSGTVDFRGCGFSAGRVLFRGARFTGGTVSFSGDRPLPAATGVHFSGGTVDFDRAVFAGGRVTFGGARFSKGSVSFRRAEFSGADVSFEHARFEGSGVDLAEGVFSAGAVRFTAAEFSAGAVTFRDAVFVGAAVDFAQRSLVGGTLDFTGARGAPPGALMPSGSARGTAPAGLIVPPTW
ncbi:pentapeptide repeat-containing protein [Streptomyces sp. NPDC088785]|uniref:pentapeptide repeat-containing protein n=1 Tax=Streptomyces sp. NPDC088785 TaxID=3365897 RepID=UPI00382815E4